MSFDLVARFSCDICRTQAQSLAHRDDFINRATRQEIPSGWFEVFSSDHAVASQHICGACWEQAKHEVRAKLGAVT